MLSRLDGSVWGIRRLQLPGCARSVRRNPVDMCVSVLLHLIIGARSELTAHGGFAVTVRLTFSMSVVVPASRGPCWINRVEAPFEMSLRGLRGGQGVLERGCNG